MCSGREALRSKGFMRASNANKTTLFERVAEGDKHAQGSYSGKLAFASWSCLCCSNSSEPPEQTSLSLYIYIGVRSLRFGERHCLWSGLHSILPWSWPVSSKSWNPKQKIDLLSNPLAFFADVACGPVAQEQTVWLVNEKPRHHGDAAEQVAGRGNVGNVPHVSFF